ncbi:putative reverse transcriptase domain-containing protein [Tanacetum coccineum]
MLADGKSLTTNTILRGCTLNLQNHLFNIDLLPIELGSFDIIVGMDWMAEHHAEVVCYEKYIRVPYGNDMLIMQGERSGVKNESRFEVISSIRMQKLWYLRGDPARLKLFKNWASPDHSSEIRNLPSRILEAQIEAVKVENIEAEDICGMLKKLKARANGTLCLDNRSWLPFYNDEIFDYARSA